MKKKLPLERVNVYNSIKRKYTTTHPSDMYLIYQVMYHYLI